MDSVTIRRLSAGRGADGAAWTAVRALCCRTGDNGDPIPAGRWELFPRIWIEPYEKLLPEWTYVAESDGRIVGYLTGCPDSRRFYREKAWRATLPLLWAVARGRYRQVPGAAGFAQLALGLRRSVERSFSESLRREIALVYPAHLHINIDSDCRRRGVGRRLTDSYFADLRDQAVPGAHVFCGAGPVEFYRKLGFRVLERVEIRGLFTFAMGARC
jgi:ribosomal protein S18 acetylase RimI-like enzyme